MVRWAILPSQYLHHPCFLQQPEVSLDAGPQRLAGFHLDQFRDLDQGATPVRPVFGEHAQHSPVGCVVVKLTPGSLIDPRHADQMVRGVVVMPRGTGKEVRILVFAEGEAAVNAEQAGADYVGMDDLVQKIQGGWLDFDMVIAVPQAMSKVGRLGRVLGPRGLMPSPKAGTIVQPHEIGRVIEEARKGRVEYRVDRSKP